MGNGGIPGVIVNRPFHDGTRTTVSECRVTELLGRGVQGSWRPPSRGTLHGRGQGTACPTPWPLGAVGCTAVDKPSAHQHQHQHPVLSYCLAAAQLSAAPRARPSTPTSIPSLPPSPSLCFARVTSSGVSAKSAPCTQTFPHAPSVTPQQAYTTLAGLSPQTPPRNPPPLHTVSSRFTHVPPPCPR